MTKQSYLRQINNPLKMSLFLLAKLPGLWFMGGRLKSCDGTKGIVTLPYGWRSKNPFRSIYFAAQVAAGEFSTGVLAMTHLQEQPPISMLVTHVEAEFFKKAAQTLTFTCEQGPDVEAVIAKAVETGESQTCRMTSFGTLPDGTIASKVYITWSFKFKKH